MDINKLAPPSLRYMQNAGLTKCIIPMPDIDETIKYWMSEGYYPGAAIMVARGNDVIYEKLYGNYTAETVVHIASAGKWLAAATIAALVDKKKLSWHDKVCLYIPELNDRKGRVTLRELLSHTAGYPDYHPKGRKKDQYQTLEESVNHIIPLSIESAPGTEFKYGGLAMQVAGRMAEVATGQSWEDLFISHIAKPLGMKDTHFVPVSDEPGFSPMLGGGARSTLDDYIRFLDMIIHDGIYRGKRILSSVAVAEMQADHVRQAKVPPDNFVAKISGNERSDIYGLGVWREKVDEAGNPIVVSSPGWAGSYPWIDKNNNVYGMMLAKVRTDISWKENFNPFYSGPILSSLVSQYVAGQKM